MKGYILPQASLSLSFPIVKYVYQLWSPQLSDGFWMLFLIPARKQRFSTRPDLSVMKAIYIYIYVWYILYTYVHGIPTKCSIGAAATESCNRKSISNVTHSEGERERERKASNFFFFFFFFSPFPYESGSIGSQEERGEKEFVSFDGRGKLAHLSCS